MKVYAKNYYLVCEPYELKEQASNSLLINTSDSNNVAKIIDIDPAYEKEQHYCRGDIILYDVNEAKKCVLGGKEYIMVYGSDVLAMIKEDE